MRTTRRLLAGILGLAAQDSPETYPRPSVFFMIADDWGAQAGAYGDKVEATVAVTV